MWHPCYESERGYLRKWWWTRQTEAGCFIGHEEKHYVNPILVSMAEECKRLSQKGIMSVVADNNGTH